MQRSSVALQYALEEHVTLIRYQQKQQKRVTAEMDAKYHQLRREIQEAHDIEAFPPKGISYQWQIGNRTYKGRSVSVFFNTTGFHTVTLTETIEKGGWFGLWDAQTVFEGRVNCRYVRRGVALCCRPTELSPLCRREITELTTDDRARFFAAVGAMYKAN